MLRKIFNALVILPLAMLIEMIIALLLPNSLRCCSI